VPLPAAVETYQRWLHLSDPEPLYVAWGAIAANPLDGEPVWLLLVDASGAGKTEIVRACADMPGCAHISSLTEAGLLSGTSRSERAEDATGGVLRVIGDRGVIVAKDFTSVLAMEKNDRGRVLAALREVYDGEYTRQLGTDGGRTLHWRGKAGLIGGVTPDIDRQYLVMARLGQRFLLYRPPGRDDEGELASTRRAVENRAHVDAMRRELRDAALGVLAGASGTARELTESERDWLIEIAWLVARGRAGVVTAYNGEVVDRIKPELPTRLAMSLAGLLAGMDAIGVGRELALRAVRNTALGCIPEGRLMALRFLHGQCGQVKTKEVALALHESTKSASRTLQELQLHGLVVRTSQGEGRADLWASTERARVTLDLASTPPGGGCLGFSTVGSEPSVGNPKEGVDVTEPSVGNPKGGVASETDVEPSVGNPSEGVVDEIDVGSDGDLDADKEAAIERLVADYFAERERGS
jgi:hypothetical protein